MEVIGTGTGVARHRLALRATLRVDAYLWLSCALLGVLPFMVWGLAMPASTYLRYTAGLVCCFFVPGLAISRRLNLAVHSEGLLVVALGLGLASSNLAYALACWVRAPWLYLLLPLASVASLIEQARSAPLTRLFKVALLPHLLVWLVMVTAAALLTRMPVHALDFTASPDGGMKLVAAPDGTLHAAIVNELRHTFPPQNPLAAGRALSYHYANELSAVVLCKFFGLPAATVCLRLLPTLFIAYATLASYVLVRRLTGSLPAALVTPLLILLGEDFSFIPGLLTSSGGVWAGEYFSSPSVFGLYFVNPNLPGVAIFFGALVAFEQALRHPQRQRMWIAVAGIALALSASYKIFFGIQAAIALGLAWLCCRGRRRLLFELGLATALAGACLMLPGALARARVDTITVVPTLYTAYVPTALVALGLSGKAWLSAIVPMFDARRASALGLVELFGLAIPLFVVGTLGARLLGIFRLFGALRRPGSAHLVLHFLAWFVVCGYVLGLGCRVTPRDFPYDYNNSVWFLVESKLVAWLFVAVLIGQLFKTWSPRRAAWLSVAQIALLAMPASINTFTVLSNNRAHTLATKDELSVAQYLEHAAKPGAVVLCESANLRRLLLGVSGVRVPHAPEFYASSFLSSHDIDERSRDQATFWQHWTRDAWRQDISSKYHLDYVVAAQAPSSMRASFKTPTLGVYLVAE